ncbi:hypothetical protein [Herpetosiphon geysericola]|uniref:Uncharacterized protein n=1 Tax=Herpetosiphon geysericola TaxID=70996 RepID=A0A0P6Y416_9CHLR|nr:hypothetical protein [Herpetosiphon geysericola]KPL90748.1 hypothetical protein SE18_05110 [Herpetosiphon geysericola]
MATEITIDLKAVKLETLATILGALVHGPLYGLSKFSCKLTPPAVGDAEAEDMIDQIQSIIESTRSIEAKITTKHSRTVYGAAAPAQSTMIGHLAQSPIPDDSDDEDESDSDDRAPVDPGDDLATALGKQLQEIRTWARSNRPSQVTPEQVAIWRTRLHNLRLRVDEHDDLDHLHPLIDKTMSQLFHLEQRSRALDHDLGDSADESASDAPEAS